MGQGHLSPKTTQLYGLLLRRHLLPTFGDMNIANIRQEDVRAWRAQRLRAGPQQEQPFGPVTVAKAYRLLRAILNTAVRDKRIRENPCQIKGADRESSPERPVLSVAEVYRLADAIEPRYRALILLATFGNLRWGELAGLRRRNLDLNNRTVRVVETVYELDRLVKGMPKSEASTRKITLPELIMPELRRHLETFTPSGPDAFVFVHAKGGQLRRSNFSKPWARALGKAGLPSGVHVHDLRHTGNTLTAEAGASLAELMIRMGHSSTRAAKGYLHAREERDRQLADVLELPGWFAERLRPAPLPAQRPVTVDLPTGLAGAYVDAAITLQLAHLRQAAEGSRNHTLYVSAVALGQLAAGGALAEDQAAALLERA
jgi:integrase